jgi:hypothetical protein
MEFKLRHCITKPPVSIHAKCASVANMFFLFSLNKSLQILILSIEQCDSMVIQITGIHNTDIQL